MCTSRSLAPSLFILLSGAFSPLWAESVHLPAGTRIDIRTERALNSEEVSVGDTFECTVTAPIGVGGSIAIPVESMVAGRVTAVKPTARSGVIAVRFVRLHTPDGRFYDIDAVLAPTREGEPVDVSSSKKSAVVLIGNETDAPGKRASTLVGNSGELTERVAERWSHSGLSPAHAFVARGSEMTIELKEGVTIEASAKTLQKP